MSVLTVALALASITHVPSKHVKQCVESCRKPYNESKQSLLTDRAHYTIGQKLRLLTLYDTIHQVCVQDCQTLE